MLIASIASELAEEGRRVLITSHTNVAVDNALERILALLLRVRIKCSVPRIVYERKYK
jgi:Tfp pilus assembly ATPase PilU